MKIIREKHSFVMRWTHWVNFPILGIMIWSGLLIYWANDEYEIRIAGHQIIHFFPDWLYNALHVPSRLSEGMAFHYLFMWFFTLNGVFYVFYTIASGSWKTLMPKRNSLSEAWKVILHDLHLSNEPLPADKYNAAQRIVYSGIIVMGILSVLTGLAIYKPVQLNGLVWAFGGYHLARIWHFALTIGYLLFFIVHIVQVTIAGFNNFRSVIAGFEVVEIPEVKFTNLDEESVRRLSSDQELSHDPGNSNFSKANRHDPENHKNGTITPLTDAGI